MEQLNDWINEGALKQCTLTNAWVYLPLLDQLDRLISAASNTILITGRKEIQSSLESKYSTQKIDLWPVPIEPNLSTEQADSFHYPNVYCQIMSRLSDITPGTLVLVGAGILGKAYCNSAKEHGAVALDLGSGFDILAGIKSRPAHWPELVEKFRII